MENGINVCGSAANDPVIAKKIDLTFKYSGDNLNINLGSTLTSDPCFASIGINNIEIYTI